MALSAVQDALGLGAATIDTMYTGLNGTVDVVSQIKAKLVAARTPGVDRGKIQSEITELQKQLKNTADSAVFNGENWISVDSTSASYNATKTVVSSFSRVGGTVKIDTLAVDLDAIKLYDGNLDTAYNAQAFPTANTAAYAAATDVGGNITVTVGAAPAINIAVAAKTSLADIATAINKLNIDGLSVGVNTGRHPAVLQEPQRRRRRHRRQRRRSRRRGHPDRARRARRLQEGRPRQDLRCL